MNTSNTSFFINYSCQSATCREGENLIDRHSLGIVLSGVLELADSTKRIQFKKGEIYSSRKNHLLKFVKYPPENDEMKTLTIYFDDKVLRDFSLEHGYTAGIKTDTAAFMKYSKNKELSAFLQSLLEYEQLLNNDTPSALLRVKQKEALLLILNYDSTLKNILFDFSDPYKIDLEAFMQQHYRFNVTVDKFAYLTGRSLAAFKRDFQKIFSTSPRNWLQHRRLQEAYYLLTEKGKSTSDIYLDLGFENLSHFSFAFKKQFGLPPSELVRV